MGVRPRCNVLLVLPGTENIYSYYHHACCRKLHFLSNGRRELILGQSVEKKTSNSLIDHSTTQRKLRPFLGVWQATRKDDAAKCKSTLDLLPEDLSLSCFGEGKLTQRSKRQGYCFFYVCDAVFLVSFLPCQTPPPDHVHESLPDHFRPCPQNTWAPYYTAARDWLKPKGVSALTDRSGVVYCWGVIFSSGTP